MSEKMYSIKSASSELGLSQVYIRRMIQQGKIQTNKTMIGDSEVWKHEIAESELNRWHSDSSKRTQRNDGRNKYTLYANDEELAQIRKLLEANDIGSILERSNKPEDTKKRYVAQKARKLAKRTKTTK